MSYNTEKQYLIDNFIKHNTIIAELSESTNTPQVKDPEKLTPSEVLDVLTTEDFNLRKRGVSDIAILAMHKLPFSKHNVELVSKTFASTPFYEKLASSSINKRDLAFALTDLLSNTQPNLTTGYPTNPQFQRFIGVTRSNSANWGHARSDNELIAHEMLSLSDKLLSYKAIPQASVADMQKETLFEMRNHLEWLIKNDAIEELYMMFDYINQVNPEIKQIISEQELDILKVNDTPLAVITALLSGITQKINTMNLLPKSEADAAWDDGFDLGYKKALNDILDRNFNDLTINQKEFVLSKLQTDTDVLVEIDNTILTKAPQRKITITLDDEIL